MLQRAASNAYSWWWASHIRTKQSKWMEQNLQDMEEKVQTVLKLIDEDGDSFAKRAEMYYKKRPELIHFVEESFRAYRALAERYDHISTELQNANNTIAYVFPEQVQFDMEEDEDEAPSRFPRKTQEVPKTNIPKVPKIPKDIKGLVTVTSAAKKLQRKKPVKAASNVTVAKSGLSKSEGLQEIDKIQKQILALQTEKEFVKSSYESGLAKYWEIEGQIRELQEKVSKLQDDFGAGIVIEDHEARTLMASAALKSCQETLAQLQEKQERSTQEAVVEHERINNAREKLRSLKDELFHGHVNPENPGAKEPEKEVDGLKAIDQEASNATEEKQDLELLREKIKEQFEIGANGSVTVTELAEKIDELVNKVIRLEASASSQAALIQRLRTETDELQSQIQTLEGDKATLFSGKNDLRDKLMEMEEKLHGLQDLNQNVQEQKNNLQVHFIEARSNINNLSQKLLYVKSDKEVDDSLKTGDESQGNIQSQESTQNPNSSLEQLQNEELKEDLKVLGKSQEEFKGQERALNPDDGLIELQNQKSCKEVKALDSLLKEVEPPADSSLLADYKEHEGKTNDSDGSMNTKPEEEGSNFLSDKTQEEAAEQDDEPDWKKLFMNGMENREKVLLTEYTTVIRNFKEVKKKLTEAEKSGDSHFDAVVKLRELKSANAKKDEQIRFLRQKLTLLQAGLGEDSESVKSMMTESPTTDKEVMEDIKVIPMDQSETVSDIEKRFRMCIDEVLEENLDFWLRFSTTFRDIQKFETEVQDLQSEMLTLEERKEMQDGSTTAKYSLKSDARPLYKHLREIHTELTAWLEKSMSLKDEVKSRFASLCDIQNEITAALKECAEDDDIKFTSYQAAKFQGEILNMKQENNKVADELQAGLDHITTLQLEVERTLAKLNEEFKLAGSKNRQNIQLPHSESRSRVPLRSFIFGSKPKRQRPSIFACMHPGIYRKHHGLRSGLRSGERSKSGADE